ncbi:MAG: hypothetical protein INR72_16070 [Williamsia herbipolensis]|nr:hypothetical protein [Williamsia herbipolensis]
MQLTVTLTARDVAADLGVYDELLACLGWERVVDLVDEEEDDAEVEAAGWGPGGSEAVLWLVTGPVPTTGLHLRLPARSRADVEAFHAAAHRRGLALSRPRRWAIYRRGEYSASALDPAGNRLEAVADE